MKSLKIDKPFLFSTSILIILGFFIFTSASLGLLARDGVGFGSIAINQIIALGVGVVGLIVTALFIPYRFWKTYAVFFFLAALGLNLILFLPSLGFEHGGARRWISFGSFSIQPSEFLKLGFIIYFSAWLAHVKDKVSNWKYGLMPFAVIALIIGPMLIAQSDTKTFVIIVLSGVTMLFVAGARLRDIAVVGLIGIVFVGAIVYARPYARERVMTFLNPSADPLKSGYQIQQSLIAIGSGGLLGRGFGQSIQKFNYLPEPIGDSIFAVFAEEWGFVGSLVLLALFIFFAFRGLKIARNSADLFGGLMIIGVVTIIVAESFMNIASMLGVIPLSGMPLLFVSHGGTALIVTLVEVGIILNISRYQKKQS